MRRYRLDHASPAQQALGRDLDLTLRLTPAAPAAPGSVRVYPNDPAADPVDVPCGEEYHCCTPDIQGIAWQDPATGEYTASTVVGQVVLVGRW